MTGLRTDMDFITQVSSPECPQPILTSAFYLGQDALDHITAMARQRWSRVLATRFNMLTVPENWRYARETFPGLRAITVPWEDVKDNFAALPYDSSCIHSVTRLTIGPTLYVTNFRAMLLVSKKEFAYV